MAVDGYEFFDPKSLKEIPAHWLYTVLVRKHVPVERFYQSDSLSKLYVFQVLREKANVKFNDGDIKAALTMYAAVP